VTLSFLTSRIAEDITCGGSRSVASQPPYARSRFHVRSAMPAQSLRLVCAVSV
jgi:hypothetical protein